MEEPLVSRLILATHFLDFTIVAFEWQIQVLNWLDQWLMTEGESEQDGLNPRSELVINYYYSYKLIILF